MCAKRFARSRGQGATGRSEEEPGRGYRLTDEGGDTPATVAPNVANYAGGET